MSCRWEIWSMILSCWGRLLANHHCYAILLRLKPGCAIRGAPVRRHECALRRSCDISYTTKPDVPLFGKSSDRAHGARYSCPPYPEGGRDMNRMISADPAP